MEFKKIEVKGKEIEVSLDYYQDEGIRMPLDLREAHEISKKFGCRLPTKSEVDAIWKAADIKLDPAPLPPTRAMTTLAYFRKHNEKIESQLKGLNTCGMLIAGHKKDIVDHPVNSTRVAIYGWHRKNGKPIQPYSTVHGWYYKDYSHGLRLIKV